MKNSTKQQQAINFQVCPYSGHAPFYMIGVTFTASSVANIANVIKQQVSFYNQCAKITVQQYGIAPIWTVTVQHSSNAPFQYVIHVNRI